MSGKANDCSDNAISPSPWSADDWDDETNGDVRIRDANGEEIAQPFSSFHDACLMASAPELLECLKEAVGEFCHECEDTRIESCRGRCFVAKWRDALSKVECETGAAR